MAQSLSSNPKKWATICLQLGEPVTDAGVRERRSAIEIDLTGVTCKRFDPLIFLIEGFPELCPGESQKNLQRRLK
jgi:hypothetical protein